MGDYYVVKAVVDGKADEIMVEAAKYGELSNGGNVVSKMTKDENNIITKVTVKTDGVDSNGDGYIIGSKAVVVEDEVINIGNNSYTYANDVVVFQYDKSADKFSKKSITSLDETYTLAAQVEDNVVVAIYYVVE